MSSKGKMNILLLEADYETKFRPLGLMRISSMHKAKGDKVYYIKGIKAKHEIQFEPDKIMMTTLFTYSYPETIKTLRYYKTMFPNADFWVGGILASTKPELFYNEGVKLHHGLLPEAERYPPDYDLFPDMDYSLTFITRGCINSCGFCVVPQLEGKLVHRPNWINDINPKFKKIIFFDNNWLGLPIETLKEDIKKLKEITQDYNITSIDFNQSLDCRLFTEEKVKLLQGLPLNPLRFSFDHMGQNNAFQKAVVLGKKYGFKNIRVDILYNWIDTPEDFYYRLKEVVMAVNGTGGCGVLMRYAPLDRVDRMNHVGPKWTKQEANAVHKINPYPYGQVSSKSLEEFEYFFGKDAKEFRILLNFPDIKRMTVMKRNKFNKQKILIKLSQNGIEI
jgi:hypothetical protein